MNWKLVFSLSPVGIIMGILMVTGLGSPGIQLLWIFFCFTAAYVIAKSVGKKWIINSLLVGIIWGIVHNVIQSIYFDSYLRNNMEYEKIMDDPESLPESCFVLFTGPLAGMATGIVIITFAWICRMWLINKK